MYDFFADSSAIGEKEIIIRGSDLNHMKNVLRLQIGEQICIHEESTGKEYRCEIAGYEKDVAHLHIMWVEEANRELPSKIYLFQGLPKGSCKIGCKKGGSEAETLAEHCRKCSQTVQEKYHSAYPRGCEIWSGCGLCKKSGYHADPL